MTDSENSERQITSRVLEDNYARLKCEYGGEEGITKQLNSKSVNLH